MSILSYKGTLLYTKGESLQGDPGLNGQTAGRGLWVKIRLLFPIKFFPKVPPVGAAPLQNFGK